ncbi:NADH:flavin oxidoreductase [Bacillus salacetis]|uniref:oxidoreductase n=1 Tax=Bacillus salacetis TaxID=2315464 RepID=UPI003B9DD537
MTQENFSTLFSSVTIKDIVLANRIGLAPMTRTSATPEGLATDDMVQYYTNFAKGGFGFILTEGTYTDDRYSQGYLNQPGIINDEQIDAWKKVTTSVKHQGAKIFVQLMHAGALSQGNRFSSETAGASAVKPKGEQLGFYGGNGEFAMPKEMTEADIQDVIKGFVAAARNAKEAGFDGIEIHGANGYVLDQFLTTYTNQRDDHYGGSLENHLRLPIEVIKAVREEVGTEFPVGIRLSQAKVNDSDYKWENGESDAEMIFRKITEAGVDYIHIAEPDATSPAFSENGPPLVELVKKYTDTVVIANGSLGDPESAETLLRNGRADIVTIGKAALANQDWADKVKEGKKLEEFDFQKTLLPQATLKEFEVKPQIEIFGKGMTCGSDGICE